MELLSNFSSSLSPNCFKSIHKGRIFVEGKISCVVSANGFSSARPFLTQKLDGERKSVIAAAGKKNKKKKEDSHTFVARPDEATGPFPEAVLLKKREVQEDGRAVPEFADAEEEKLFEFLNLQLESDLNVDQMRHYEVVYLIHEDRVDEVESVISKAQDFVREKKGKVWRLNNWGLRRLAYKIQKARNANYVLMNFELEAKWINDFKSMLDKDERVIRHLVIKRDEAITEDCPPPPEFHTLRANITEDDMDQYDDDGQDMDDENELDMINNDGDNDIEDGIVFIDEDGDDVEDNRHDGSGSASRGARSTLKAEKIAR
ncbi:protein REGULATOR OF FATTY ACID COMPOSITION 3, chloroplastic [Magnolia sinica]|uniref:protein REGULATOR OF FATTY ACID COMPOSITION 3, chloroplastic n=1 Tax=Magnolia sinica TaxID=86752 RepID=UPI002658BD9E|nr:protein REGULATOR OF FATTY ACID COMPOSITION 3, chloroplastic [Magnolia sinica]